MGDHITRYDRMPIPPIDANTQYFQAGAVRIGVEFRVLSDDVVAQIRGTLEAATGSDVGQLTELDDTGVSLHVFVAGQEHLRFDCFREDPHYHYVGWARKSNEVLHLDPVADGDPLLWALERIRTRLPQMLERAGVPELAKQVDVAELERVLPRVTELAFRSRFAAEHEAQSAA
jgi:hypothetical protein